MDIRSNSMLDLAVIYLKRCQEKVRLWAKKAELTEAEQAFMDFELDTGHDRETLKSCIVDTLSDMDIDALSELSAESFLEIYLEQAAEDFISQVWGLDIRAY